MLLHFIVAVFSAGITMLGAGAVSGQDFPQKPVRTVASEPGGAGDFAARLIAQGIAGGLGQQVIVKERFFSAGVETVASSPPQLAAIMKSGMARMGKVIKDAGIRGE